MLILIVTLLALLPALAILYPFLSKGVAARYANEDETSMAADLSRRWSSAMAGLRNTELEHAIGNLDDENYAAPPGAVRDRGGPGHEGDGPGGAAGAGPARRGGQPGQGSAQPGARRRIRGGRMSMARYLAAVAAALLAVATSGLAGATSEGVSIQGRVANATLGGQPAPGLEVVLHREGLTLHEHDETATDAEGRFRFDGVVYEPDLTYGVTVVYQGALYGADLDLSNGTPPMFTLAVYESTSSQDALSVSKASVLLAGVDAESQTLWALEIVEVVNDTEMTYVPRPGAYEPAALRSPSRRERPGSRHAAPGRRPDQGGQGVRGNRQRAPRGARGNVCLQLSLRGRGDRA